MQAGTSSTTTPKPPLVATTKHFSGLAYLLASRMAQLTAAATATVILPALIPAAALSVTSGGDAHASVPAGVVMLLAAAVLIAVEAYQRQQAGENFNMQKAFSQVITTLHQRYQHPNVLNIAVLGGCASTHTLKAGADDSNL